MAAGAAKLPAPVEEPLLPNPGSGTGLAPMGALCDVDDVLPPPEIGFGGVTLPLDEASGAMLV